ncbi:MAG: hypothetical protein EXR58_05465 [Chloroflexi bacterium]|nr:hypothetical protein [Chloroflexota bacterium]
MDANVKGGPDPWTDLTSGEGSRLREWIAGRRSEIAADPTASERNQFWMGVTQSLDAESLAILLTAKELNEERDALTGILNRRGLAGALSEALDWQDRTGRNR